VNAEIGDIANRSFKVDELGVKGAIVFLDDDSTGKSEISIEPGSEKTTTVGLNASLVETVLGKLREGGESQAWGISMGTNDLETSVVGVESFTDDKSDKGGVVSSEEITTASFEFPVFDFVDFSETFSKELLTRVVNNVERRRTVVDKVNAVKSDWLSIVNKI